jgi:hypothetical protein
MIPPFALLRESGLWYDEHFQRRFGAPPEAPPQSGERE